MLCNPLECGEAFTALALNYWLPPFFGSFWEKAKTRICADGGANRVVKFFNGKSFTAPNWVVGDFDSLKAETRKKLGSLGSKFIKIWDQDRNDIQKCLSVLQENNVSEPVVVFGGFGGRFDQTIASIHIGLSTERLRIWFIDENNVVTWIRPGDTGILCPQQWTQKICGLLPIACPVKHIKTEGLKWNCDFGLSMNSFISSSNEIAEGADKVLIQTSDPVLWMNQTKKMKDLPLEYEE
jgi:thiamine pyrophosphokinase